MKLNITLLTFFILITFSLCGLDSSKIQVAVIGANMGGVSLSHYLNQKFHGKANITIFEKETTYGGSSIRTEKIGDKVTELGEQFIYDWNMNLKELLLEFNLNFTIFDSHKVLGIYNGDQMQNIRLNHSIALFKSKYGEGLQILITLLKRFQDDFHVVYESLNKTPKKTILEILSLTKLDKILLQKRTDEVLQRNKIKMSMIDELIRPILFSYNNMETDMHIYEGLRTLFSYFTNKFTIKDGLITLLEKMIYNPKFLNKNLFLNLQSNVFKIKYITEENKYEVFYKNNENKVNSEKFDKVVFANMLFNDKIKFENLKNDVLSKNLIDLNLKNQGTNKGTVMNLKSYYVIGNLNMTSLLFSKNNSTDDVLNDPSDLIIVNDIKGYAKINQIINICKNCYINRNYQSNKIPKNSLFKISTMLDLTKEDLKDLFQDGFSIRDEYTKNHYKLVNLPYAEGEKYIMDIVLDDNGLYYLKSYQCLNSNLEYSTIFAKNIANLIYEEYKIKIPTEKLDYLNIDL